VKEQTGGKKDSTTEIGDENLSTGDQPTLQLEEEVVALQIGVIPVRQKQDRTKGGDYKGIEQKNNTNKKNRKKTVSIRGGVRRH